MTAHRHKYQPLEDGSDTTRILTLKPGQRDEPLTGTLEAVHMEDAGDYVAVSYVWADAVPSSSAHEILIDNEDGESVLTLTGGSIFAALRRLRRQDSERRIWADQCCINQDDAVERSRQVQYMNRIYQNASRVAVWLGTDEDNEGAAAFSLIRKLDERLKAREVDVTFDESQVEDLERYVEENRKPLQGLTDRPWFRRGWVVQEVGTITPATLFWGENEIDWDTLAGVCEQLKGHHRLRSTLSISTSDICFLYRRFIEPDQNTHHVNRFNFIYELQRSRHLHFSDERDRIFAFLGHYSVRTQPPLGCGPIVFKADYTKTVEQTYMDLAVQILEKTPDAACILLAAVQYSLQNPPRHRDMLAESDEQVSKQLTDDCKLPSWVPDWRRSEGIILAEPVCPHHAHGESTTNLELEKERLLLRLEGLRIDAIEECSQPWLSDNLYKKKTSQDPITVIEYLWHTVCKKGRFDLEEKYLNGQSSFFAFMQTLSNGCVQAAGHERRPYQEIPDTVWLAKAAAYVTDTLGVLSDDISDDIKEAAVQEKREGEHEKWSRWAASVAEGRVFARTDRWYYVLGPAAMKTGDLICVFFGAKVPFCLRPAGEKYLLVGECYVHGLMNGEAIDMLSRQELVEMKFEII